MEEVHDQPRKNDTQNETLKPFAAIALPSQASTETISIKDDDRAQFPYSVDQAESYFLDAGYLVASRTISNYCHTNRFQCKKFSSEGVRRWFIKDKSLATHLKQLKLVHSPNAGDSKQSHATNAGKKGTTESTSQPFAGASASDSNDYEATAVFNVKYVKMLEKQVAQKDSQLNSLQEQADQVTKLTNGLGRLLLNQAEPPPEEREDQNPKY